MTLHVRRPPQWRDSDGGVFPDALIRAINDDIEMARDLCGRPEHAALAKSDFFFQALESADDASDGGTSVAGISSEGQVQRSGSDTSIDHWRPPVRSHIPRPPALTHSHPTGNGRSDGRDYVRAETHVQWSK